MKIIRPRNTFCTRCFDSVAIYDLLLFVCFLCLFVIVTAFYVRVDTVVSRNGMNKAFCITCIFIIKEMDFIFNFIAGNAWPLLSWNISVFIPFNRQIMRIYFNVP